MTRHRNFDGRKRVAIAGFGVVGRGVYDRLRADSARYDIVGVYCRNPERHANAGVPAPLLTDQFEALSSFDILIEAIGGLSPAGDLVFAAIARGADVVSANKTLFSRRYDALHAAAARAGSRLRFSAAVGGGVPMLEAVEEQAKIGRIARIDAVLNGTTNFVLDRISAGLSLEDAARLAVEAGFAEANPAADIDGVDAAEKLSLLVRRGFGVGVEPDAIARDRLSSVSESEIVAARAAGSPFKQVASARREGDNVEVDVRLMKVAADNPLAAPTREENCLVITSENGEQTVLSGKGAGREPTTDSVLADIRALAAAPAVSLL